MWGRCGDTAGDGGDGEQGGVAGGDTLSSRCCHCDEVSRAPECGGEGDVEDDVSVLGDR